MPLARAAAVPAKSATAANPFIITGLPRSRTAWLAAVCNTIPEAICWHEPMAWCADWAALKRVLDTSLYQYAGVSDSLAGFALSELVRETKARVLIVQRSKQEVSDSLLALFPGLNTRRLLDTLEARLAGAVADVDALVVPYEDLSCTRLVCAALHFLMPEARICPEKIRELQRLNVQADMDRVRVEIAAAQGRKIELFGPDVLKELAA